MDKIATIFAKHCSTETLAGTGTTEERRKMTRLILQPGDSGREQMAAWKASRSLGIEMVSGHALQPGDVPD
tara:strand:- start:91 stop:303 length:213 start_codon:yes stop_codon:yes gene_type:complete